MYERLDGLTALITGAAGGIGVAMAEAFAGAGARLALVDKEDASELAARLGAENRAFRLDLADTDAIDRVLGEIGKTMGVDVLVNNAGLGIVAPAEEQSVQDWDRTQDINLRAPWRVAVAALPFPRSRGVAVS